MAKISKLERKTERLKFGSVWSALRKELIINPFVSLAVAIILLLMGGYFAAIINYISISEDGLFRYILSSSLSFLILAIGFIFFLPFWKFRRKYYFLEENIENKLAKRLVSIHNRSAQALTSFDGINAIQFFKIETHTGDNHVHYKFSKIFSIKAKYFNLSKLKNKEFEVPIQFFDWLKNPNIPAPDYGETINELLYEWLERRSEDDLQFANIIDNWNITFKYKPKTLSPHYHVLFEPKESVNADRFTKSGEIDPIFLMEYNGVKDSHVNRQYYSVRIQIDDPEEGIFEGILLIIGNKLRLDIDKIKQIIGGILVNEGGDSGVEDKEENDST